MKWEQPVEPEGASGIQIVGYGTLLSEASARRTAPSVTRFRTVRVPGYIRLFNKVSPAWRARYDGDDPLAIAVLANPHQD